MATTDPLQLQCVATTGDSFCKSIEECDLIQAGRPRRWIRGENAGSNCFRDAKFSGDGTTVITQNADHCLRTFVLPVDLLDANAQSHALSPHSKLQSPTPIQSYAIYPHFNLRDPSTTVFLSASSDLPISLNNALHSETVHAKYPLIDPATEEYHAPSSLLWTRDGAHFVAGTCNHIYVFDPSRDGSGPLLTHKTAAGKREKKLYGSEGIRGCKGTVSALSISSDGVLAAGSRERQVALYDHEGSGQCATAFSVAVPRSENGEATGTGITQIAWSPCGTYLLIAERSSDFIQVYDMRNTLGRVAWLSGRKADTPQKLGMDVLPASNGYEVWAGGTDGCVRMWRNPGSIAGDHGPDAVMKVHDGK